MLGEDAACAGRRACDPGRRGAGDGWARHACRPHGRGRTAL